MQELELLEDMPLKTQIENEISSAKKKIEEIDEKIKNNDYNECNRINHDKMVLENRKMILENQINLKQIDLHLHKLEDKFEKFVNDNNELLTEIINDIYKNKELSQGKENLLKLLNKLPDTK